MPSRRLAWTVAVIAGLTMTVSYIDRQTFAFLGDTVTKELHLSETEYGWLTSAFNIAYLFAVPVAGWWLDRAGARRGLLISVLLWSTIAGLHALVPGFLTLFALRIALGIAEAPSFPGAAQTMYRILPAADRPRGYALLFTGSSIGASTAPLVAGWVFGLGGWQFAFLGTAVVGLCWLPAWLLVTSRPGVAAQLDAANDAVADAPKLPWRVALGEAVRQPATRRALLAVLAVAPAVGFGLSWGAKYLAGEFHLSTPEMRAYLWLPPLGLDAGALLFGDLAARLKRPPWLLGAAALLATSLVLLPLCDSPWLVTVVLTATLVGGGGCNTLITTELLAGTPAARVSVTAGTLTAAQSVALIIAGPVMGAAADATGSYNASAIGCALWVVPGVAVWLGWQRAR